MMISSSLIFAIFIFAFDVAAGFHVAFFTTPPDIFATPLSISPMILLHIV